MCLASLDACLRLIKTERTLPLFTRITLLIVRLIRGARCSHLPVFRITNLRNKSRCLDMFCGGELSDLSATDGYVLDNRGFDG